MSLSYRLSAPQSRNRVHSRLSNLRALSLHCGPSSSYLSFWSHPMAFSSPRQPFLIMVPTGNESLTLATLSPAPNDIAFVGYDLVYSTNLPPSLRSWTWRTPAMTGPWLWRETTG